MTVKLNSLALFAFLVFALSPVSTCRAAPAALEDCYLVILADPTDPFYPLAQEIATAESAPLVASLAEAFACQPVFLIWVASPSFLSTQSMIAFGQVMYKQTSAISSGIITGSTMKLARQLWHRHIQVPAQLLAAANAPNPADHRDQGQITTIQAGRTDTQSLNLESFLQALRSVDYLTFTGDGGNSFLKLAPEIEFTPADIPALPPLVMGTGSCQTVQPWRENNLALRFIDQGAAAYTGFVFSPNEGYLIGEFAGLPFRYTWPDYPIGYVLQVQNHGTLQGFAAFHFQHLLGDPRLALQSKPSFQVDSDRISGDLFYNSRLQMATIGADKYLLIEQPGGELTLQLRRQPPWYWHPTDILLDALDHTLVFSLQSGGDWLALAFSLLPLGWVIWQISRRRIHKTVLRLALALGLVLAALQAVYSFARLEHLTITSKTVVISPLGILAGFLLATCGALVYFQARRRLVRLVGLLVATFTSWGSLVFGLFILVAINQLGFVPQTGVALYNYALAWMPGVAFGFELLTFGFAFWGAALWLKRSLRQSGGELAVIQSPHSTGD